MTINELLAIVPRTLWDAPITIEAAKTRTVPVRSVRIDTGAPPDKMISLVPEP